MNSMIELNADEIGLVSGADGFCSALTAAVSGPLAGFAGPVFGPALLEMFCSKER